MTVPKSAAEEEGEGEEEWGKEKPDSLSSSSAFLVVLFPFFLFTFAQLLPLSLTPFGHAGLREAFLLSSDNRISVVASRERCGLAVC